MKKLLSNEITILEYIKKPIIHMSFTKMIIIKI